MSGITPYEKDFFSLFDSFAKDFFPQSRNTDFRIDITDTGDGYLLEADLPGMKKEDIHIDISDDRLKISAERHSENKTTDDNGKVVHSERFYGSFERCLDISMIDSQNIKASYIDGVLKLVMPKKVETAPSSRRLEIL